MSAEPVAVPEPTPSEPTPETPIDDDVSGEWEACATDSVSVRPAGAAVLLLIDRSSSMNEDNRWNQAASALASFFQSSETSGISVGLRFFPDGEMGCGAPDCDITACAQPLVNAEPLLPESGVDDVQETRLVDAIWTTQAATTAVGGTPLYEVLAGGLDWASAFQSADPSVRTSVLLLTDGEASGCNESLDEIATLVADAYDGFGISTQVVGFDGMETQQIERIAEAGGTQAYFLAADDAENQLLQALTTFRGDSFGCELALSAAEGEELDPAKVNVLLEKSSGPTQLNAVADAQQCEDAPGWYYSSAESIELCPAACDTLQAASATVTMVFGCNTAR